MGQHVEVVVDLGAKNVGATQYLQPMRDGAGAEHVGQRRAHGLAVHHPLRRAGETRVVDPLRMPEHSTQRRPAVAVVRSDHQPAVRRFKRFVGRGVGRGAADAGRQFAVAEETGQRRLLQRQCRVHQADVEVAAEAVVVPGVQLGQHRHAGHVTGDHIDHRRLHLGRRGAGRADQAHQPGVGLQYAVDASAVGVRTLLAIGGNRAVNQVRFQRGHGFITQTEPGHDAGAHALDQYVGLQHQAFDHRRAVRVFEVQAQAQFAAIETVKQRAVFTDPGRAEGTAQFAFMGFDLDHARAHVGHQHGRGGACGDLGEIEDGQAVQCLA
ncbi:hypothetical protein D3C87_1054210 [compost metagenome]